MKRFIPLTLISLFLLSCLIVCFSLSLVGSAQKPLVWNNDGTEPPIGAIRFTNSGREVYLPDVVDAENNNIMTRSLRPKPWSNRWHPLVSGPDVGNEPILAVMPNDGPVVRAWVYYASGRIVGVTDVITERQARGE